MTKEQGIVLLSFYIYFPCLENYFSYVQYINLCICSCHPAVTSICICFHPFCLHIVHVCPVSSLCELYIDSHVLQLAYSGCAGLRVSNVLVLSDWPIAFHGILCIAGMVRWHLSFIPIQLLERQVVLLSTNTYFNLSQFNVK